MCRCANSSTKLNVSQAAHLAFIAGQNLMFCPRLLRHNMPAEMEKCEKNMSAEVTKKYDANSISILEGLEAVRKRPGMYIGSVSTKGLNHLIYEIVDNSVDEHLAGYCNEITVTLEKDGTAIIKDNGRGIPVGINEKAGIPAVEVVFTILHAGGKFGDGGY